MRQRSMTSKMTWIRPPTPGLLVILEAEVARWSRRGHFEFQYDPTAFRLKRLPIARMFGSLAFARTQSTKAKDPHHVVLDVSGLPPGFRYRP